MNMDLFVDLLLYMIMGFCVARIIIGLINHRLEEKLQQVIEIHQRVNMLIRAVRIEEHDNQIYWFDAENDSFIAQGKNRDEIVEVLKSRWPKNIFLVSENELIAGPDFHPVTISVVKTKDGFKVLNGQD